MSRIGKFIETENRIEANKGCGEGRRESYCLMIVVHVQGVIKMFWL